MAGCGGRRLNQRPPVGGRDHGVAALEQHHRATLRRGGQRPRQPVAFMGEQPLEFALVRRQHAGAADRLEQRLGLVLEAGQGIRIEDAGLGRLEHAQHAVAQHLSDAGARPEQHAVAPWIGQDLRELLIVGEGRDHDRAQLGGVDRERVLGADHGDQPGAGTQRGARRHARGTRGGGAAAQHQSVAMGVLVAGSRCAWAAAAATAEGDWRTAGPRARAHPRECRCPRPPARRHGRGPAAADGRAWHGERSR